MPFPSQTSEGSYAVTLSTGITDPSGNALTAPYQASFLIDKTGPRIVADTPSGTVNGAVSSIDVTFNKPINLATFTPG